MAHVRDPRMERWGMSPALGTLELIAALPGIFGALEVLLVGEELSTLGERILPLTRTGGPFAPETGLYSWAPLLIGGPVFTLSALRVVGALGLLANRRWAYRLLLGLALPSCVIDLACLAAPARIPWLAFDLLSTLALWRRAR